MEKKEQVETAPEILEEEIREKYRQIKKSLRSDHRYLKAGAFRKNPLLIHSPVIVEKYPGFLSSADRIAFTLTSAAARGESVPSIKEIVLLPEIAAGSRHLLSHLYDPRTHTLICYVYPLRLDRSETVENGGRLDGGHRGIISEVLSTIEHTKDPENRLRKFLIPLESIEPDEMRMMEEIHELCFRHEYA